jgi:hypothetical protein
MTFFFRQSISAPYFDSQSIPRMTSKPNMLNTANFAGRVLTSTTMGQFSTHFLQVTALPTVVATHVVCSIGLVLT